MKNKGIHATFLRIILFTHITALLVGIGIIIFFPFDKLRWNCGYVVSWLILVTAIMLTFSRSRDFRFKKQLKVYLSIFWGLPVISILISIVVWVFGIVFITILLNMFIPQSPVFENENYTIRATKSPMIINYDVYRIETFTEKRIGSLDHNLILDANKLKSFKYNEEKNQGILEYTDTICTFELNLY